MRRTPLRRRAPLRPGTKPLRRATKPLRRRTPLERRTLAPAARAQRDAVRGARCIVCGTWTAIDPAHLVPRGRGGCDHPLCVVPLCRTHHRAYDRGRLDLVPYLEPRYRAQVAHAVGHLGLAGALRRLSGRRGARRLTAATKPAVQPRQIDAAHHDHGGGQTAASGLPTIKEVSLMWLTASPGPTR